MHISTYNQRNDNSNFRAFHIKKVVGSDTINQLDGWNFFEWVFMVSTGIF